MSRRKDTRSSEPQGEVHGDTPKKRHRWLSLGVLAHVDAGKTSLTKALLHAGGALADAGRVDDGTTQTDTMRLERRRGITIRAAVASFEVDDATVNIIDTPGHPDFIAEVDRSVAVLDGAVLLVSAVEGVQAQTTVLHRALQRRGVPTVVVVNKIDRAGADVDRVLDAISRRLTPALIPLGTVQRPGTPTATFQPQSWQPLDAAEAATAQLAEHDEQLLHEWISQGWPMTPQRLLRSLRAVTQRCLAHPVLFTSARTGAGVRYLIDTLVDLLAVDLADADTDVSGQVFKVERSPDGDRVCLLRLRAGTLAARQAVDVGEGRTGTVTALEIYEPGGPVSRARASAGQVTRVHGLATARVGDWLGRREKDADEAAFPPPMLRTTVSAADPAQQLELHRALSDLADVDPLIRLRPDTQHGALRIDVYGTIQQEVIADTLGTDYGIEVRFSSPTTICVERPAGCASFAHRLDGVDHAYGYTLALMVEPGAPGTGIKVEVSANRSGLPLHVYGNTEDYRTAVLGYLAAPLAAGPHGWPVTDVRITITDSGYPPAGPTPADVRGTVALVAAEAVRQAGTVVCEPVDRFHLETPGDTVAGVLSLLAQHRAIPDSLTTATAGPSSGQSTTAVLTGTIPAAELDAVRAGLSTAAHGEALMDSALDHYEPIPRNRR